MASRDDRGHPLGYGQEIGSACEGGEHIAGVPSRIARIGTKGRFCFMDLPVELRLKIYNDLLVCPEGINIPPSPEAPASEIYPSVSILQTCKTINEEGTPILYSTNTFTITLPLERRPSKPSSPSTSTEPSTPTFHLSHFRWSTLTQMTTLSFQSSNEISIPKLSISSSPRPSFSCSGKDIMARFSGCDVRYSPKGPDEYMALSVSNWVSTKVMRAELSAFQRELEDMMRGGPVLALGGWGAGGGGGGGGGDDDNDNDNDADAATGSGSGTI